MPTEVYTKEEVDAIIANLPPPGGSGYRKPEFFEFYRNPAVSLNSNNSTTWHWPGAALSASTIKLYAQLNLSLHYARFLVVWTPGNGGVRLIHSDDGPTNITEIAKFAGIPTATPIVSAVNVTAELQSLVSAGAYKHLGLQVRGSGFGPARIYSALIETVWN